LTSISQNTNQNSVKKSGLRRILFDKPCMQRILSMKKSGLRRICFIKKFPLIVLDAFDFTMLVQSTNSLVLKMIQTPTLSDHNHTICSNQYLRKDQIRKCL